MASVSHENLIDNSGSISPEALRLAEDRGVVRELAQLGEMTQELFPGNCAVDVHHDPEIPNYSLIVFNVVGTGSVEDVARRNSLWHARLVEIGPNRPGVFCLSIDIRP